MKHLYVVVNCKGYGNVCAVKYVGEDIGGVEIGFMTLEHFAYWCAQCHQEHHYRSEETRIERFDSPPPPGWSTPF